VFRKQKFSSTRKSGVYCVRNIEEMALVPTKYMFTMEQKCFSHTIYPRFLCSGPLWFAEHYFLGVFGSRLWWLSHRYLKGIVSRDFVVCFLVSFDRSDIYTHQEWVLLLLKFRFRIEILIFMSGHSELTL
jgi:hypothetical protein